MSLDTAEARTGRPRISASRAYPALVRALGRGWLRDRSQVFFTILLPLMFMVLLASVFGSTANTVSRVIAVGDVAVLDEADPDTFTVTEAAGLDEALAVMRAGDADAAVVQDGDTVRIYPSSTNSTSGAIAAGNLSALVDDVNVEVLAEAAPSEPVLTTEVEEAEGGAMRPIQYLAPGILAWGIAIAGVFGAAGTMVDWKRDKLLRRLRLTPASVKTFLGAKVSVNLAVAVVQTAVFLAVAALAFGLELSAWTWFAVPLVVLGTFAFLAIGVVIGGIAQTSPAAAGLSNLVTMPMAFVSGAFYPLALSPEWVQWLSYLSPMRYLNEALQAVVVYGSPPSSVLPQVGMLAAFAVAIGLVSWKTFKFDEL
ncbi:ABC transporter permease [Glycomyces sp. TRM65418]|uniref:ABC transporter permease n=1 Tax=Glycomyces sp. TRM65418 TaxID=2867006 RepID=UPI001CE555D0|nr:ABC transporter permease [Glycomyces sp. TRM65418]MCC3762381.1 ABC transporter permease [Glycomyces sp. TRM65418]QZD56428.1 ABC transporter permease [Glycomyces sp. TRM65418]